MDIKIIFIDFDWTIFDHRTYSINESTIEAIKQARNKGIKVIINTGRSYYSLLSKQVVRDLKVDGYVVNNEDGRYFMCNKIYFTDILKLKCIPIKTKNIYHYKMRE